MSVNVSASDIMGTAGVAAAGARLHLDAARSNVDTNTNVSAAIADLIQALSETVYASRIHGSLTMRALDSRAVDVSCDAIRAAICDAIA